MKAENQYAAYRKKLAEQNLRNFKDLKALVKPLIKPATKITVKKPSTIPNDTRFISHFGGQPYFEEGDIWPQDDDGDKYEFVFQIYNDGSLSLPKDIKLLQFYYDFSGAYDPEDAWYFRVFTELKKDTAVIIKKPAKLKTVKYCEMEFEAIKSLPRWEDLRSCSKNAYMLSCVLDEEKPWSRYAEAALALIGEYDMSSQLGGYPQWLQNNESPGKSYHLLFQLDSEESAGLMWSDMGLLYVFHNHKTNQVELILQNG